MTAFSSLERTFAEGRLAWEIRGVNHRFLDITLRLPEGLRTIEGACRERLRSRLRRGKCDLSLRFSPETAEGRAIRIDDDRLEALLAACREIEDRWPGGQIDPLAALAWPGIVVDESIPSGALSDHALDLLDEALEAFCQARAREGGEIALMLERRCTALDAEIVQLRQALPELLERQRQRLETRLAELQGGYDESRLEQEIAVLAQRSDVEEELDRLEAHLAEVRRLLGADEPVGRRLDFLMQELNREANTLASKSLAIESTRSAVELKVIIEQMREQIQNVE